MFGMALRKLSLGLALVSLTIVAVAKPATTKRANDDNLTETLAQARRAQVKNANYQLWLTLFKGSDTYKGRAIITTELNDTKQPLTVDFLWKTIETLTVNGEVLKSYPSRKGSFDIPAAKLKPTTTIEVTFVNEFNKEGIGFQRVVDPEDKAEYFYTDFEPYEAHEILPCFDQPDIRASLRLSIDAPSDWKALGNELIKNETRTDDRTVTEFYETKPISPYLYFAGAGPFVEWKDKLGDLPLYLYARKSIAKYVDADKIMATSKKGLRFFNDYFDYPYPFSKFGQVFIPEFASGGMENPGMITYNERGIYRGPVSEATRAGRDNLILHEMAHMWFGDLVTMKWWSDLWLNESFATYLAAVAQDRAFDYKGTWLDFFSEKGWGYWQDQLVTTHPIETPVPDIRTAKGNFDGITYAKGAATLKQLHFFAGEEGFRDGLRTYFKKYAWQNTVREQFITEIANASKQDLKAWTKAWLQTAGPNRVSVDWSCNNDRKVDKFNIIQEPSTSKTLAPHRTRIALYTTTKGAPMEIFKTHDVTYSTRETKVAELINVKCPAFVYPNYDDQDYALFALDLVSLQAAGAGLKGDIIEPLTRVMVWNTLSQMVRDTKLATKAFFEIALPAIENEKDTDVLAVILSGYGPVIGNYYTYLTKEERVEIAPRLETIAWNRTLKAPSETSLQLSFFDFYVSITQSETGLIRLRSFLDEKGLPTRFKLDQDRRWAIINTLAKNGFKDVETLIAAEESKDPSTTGKRSAYAARAAIPTESNKAKFWKEFQTPEKIPFSSLRAAAGSFNSSNYLELSEPFVQPFFKQVTTMDWKQADELVSIYFDRLFPHTLCSSKLLKESKAKLAGAKNLTPLAKRAWLEANDELEKCVSIRQTTVPTK